MKRKWITTLREKWGVSPVGVAMFLSVAVLCGISFTFVYDLWHTSQVSFGYLKGHFLDLYDYNINSLGMPTIVYYPTIYLLYALWNIPAYFLMGVDSVDIYKPWILICEKALGWLFLFFVCIDGISNLSETRKNPETIFFSSRHYDDDSLFLSCRVPVGIIRQRPCILYASGNILADGCDPQKRSSGSNHVQSGNLMQDNGSLCCLSLVVLPF